MSVIDKSQYLNGAAKTYLTQKIGTILVQSFSNVAIPTVAQIVQGFKEHYNAYFIAQKEASDSNPLAPNYAPYHDNGGEDEPFIFFDWNYPPPSSLPVDVEGNVWNFGDNYPNPIRILEESASGRRGFELSVDGEFTPDGFPDNQKGYYSWQLSLRGVQRVEGGVPVDFYDFDLVFSSSSKYETPV